MKGINWISVSCLMVFSNIVFGQNDKIKEVRKNQYQVQIKTSAVCEMCKKALEDELKFAKGIRDVNLDLKTKELMVVFSHKKTNLDNIKKIVSKTGYHAGDLKRNEKSYKNLPYCCRKETE